jgi:hypothetical protein
MLAGAVLDCLVSLGSFFIDHASCRGVAANRTDPVVLCKALLCICSIESFPTKLNTNTHSLALLNHQQRQAICVGHMESQIKMMIQVIINDPAMEMKRKIAASMQN